jgi:hypothetical protein
MDNYTIADMMPGVRNLIEAVAIAPGDDVLLLADTRSDRPSIEALRVGLKALGAQPMVLMTDPIARYGHVPKAVIEAMQNCDVAIWVWPVFITFAQEYRALRRGHEEQAKPYHVYFEGVPGLLASNYARFPNRVTWKLSEKVREIVVAGHEVRIEDDLGTNLRANYKGQRIFAMQTKPHDPPGRTHFPWARCKMYSGGPAEGTVYLSCIQGVPGLLPQPMKWTVVDGWVAQVEGGGEVGEETRRMFERVPRSNQLNEIMFGFHPKASLQAGIQDLMHWQLNDKVPWVGLGTGRDSNQFRHMDGAVLTGRLYIDDRLIVDKHGLLDRSILYHPEVLEVAAEYGDPHEVLMPASHAAEGWGP